MTQKLDIIYTDKDYLAVNKPPGIMVHGDGRSDEQTVCELLLERFPEIKDVGEPWVASQGKTLFRPGVVHRLDKDTSGILLIARNQKSFSFFKRLFQERRIKKTYRAFVYGRLRSPQGVIDRPIGRSRSDFRKWSAERSARQPLREAETRYRVLKYIENEDVSYLEVHPKTGRTHQIRVHLKALGHPIVCDSLYAEKKPCLLGFSRLALHAFALEFSAPDGTTMRIEADEPEDFQNTHRDTL